MSSSMNSRVLLVFVIAAIALPVLSFAQKDTGSIVGTVKDPSGALVTNAKVAVTDVERGTQFVTHTGDSGEFVASALKIGRYTVAVEHSGFKRAVSVPVDVYSSASL
jgi:carboxypeptidase family protein